MELKLELQKRLHKLWHPAKKKVLPGYTESETDLMRDFERGMRLRDIRMFEGWTDLTEIMEDIAFTAVFDCVNYPGGNPEALTVLQAKAHTACEFYDQVLLRVHNAITQAEKVPELIATHGAKVGIPGV